MPEEGKRALPALQAAATYDDHHVRLTGLTGSITIPKGRLPRKTSEEQSAYQIQETGLTDSPANPIPTVNEPTLENCVEPSLQYSGLDGLSTAPQSTLTYPTNLTSEHLFIPSSSMSQQPDTSDAHMFELPTRCRARQAPLLDRHSHQVTTLSFIVGRPGAAPL